MNIKIIKFLTNYLKIPYNEKNKISNLFNLPHHDNIHILPLIENYKNKEK